jgi:uncharacterized membrane protein YhaH (DUF805 family)
MRLSLRSRLFSLGGRLNVPEAFVLQMLFAGLETILTATLSQSTDWRREIELRLAIEALGGFAFLLLLTKRLHDHGWSGWWALVCLPLIPLGAYKSWRVTLLNPEVLTGHDLWWYTPASLLAVPFIIAALGVFFVPGSSRDNRFGPSPRRAPNEPAHSS